MERYDYLLELLTVKQDGTVICDDGTRFAREVFSRFKHGWTPPAVAYGTALATLVSGDLWEHAAGRRICIVSAPYKYVPTASHQIAVHLLRALSADAIKRGIEPPILVPFLKDKPGKAEYAHGDRSVRDATTASMQLHIDESLVRGSVMLVVDDIMVTGAALRATEAFLEPLGPHSLWYLHAARINPMVADEYPGLEGQLNDQSIRIDTFTVLRMYGDGEFCLNTRVLRLILETKRSDEFMGFLKAAPTGLLEDIQDGIHGSGHDYCKRYSSRLHSITQELNARASI